MRPAPPGPPGVVVVPAPPNGQIPAPPNGQFVRRPHPPDTQWEERMRERLKRRWEEREREREEGLRNMTTWRASREQRADADRKEVRDMWGPMVDRSDCRTELEVHALRLGALNRMADIARASDPTLGARVQSVVDVENVRHTEAMDQIRLQVGAQ
jgi:hypothetical protein